MDKITRIHLAKIPYEISINAQAKLNKYFAEIRDELDANLADEIMSDIEVRITEILEERNVKQNDVITINDIDAIEEQLGLPEQFKDSDIKKDQNNPDNKESKKLLRDLDNAYIGGVASGIGAYFGIDAVFIRLIFIALTFVSGLGIILYILFWILLPAAKSSSDKLQMSGQPVTAATLQSYRTTIGKRLNGRPAAIQKFILTSFRIVMAGICAFGCLFLLGVLGVLSSLTFVNPFRSLFVSYRLDYGVIALLWVIGISLIGLLIILVIRIWGKSTSHLRFSAVSLLVALILAIASTGALGVLTYNHFSNVYGNNRIAKPILVDDMSPNIVPDKLQVNSDNNLIVTYIVSNQPIHADYSAYPGLNKPSLTITNYQGTLSVNSTNLYQAAPNCLGSLCKHIYLPVNLTLYGPVLDTISNSNGATLWVNDANFGNSVSLKATNGSTININNSYANTMNISAMFSSTIQASNSTTQQVNVNIDASSSILAPTTDNLDANLPLTCDQNNAPILFLNGYTGLIKFNGQIQTLDDLNQNNCIGNNF